MKRYLTTLTSGAMLSVLSVHALEDIVLLSIGRFAPVPTLVMYAVGMGLSWLVFGVFLAKVLQNKHLRIIWQENKHKLDNLQHAKLAYCTRLAPLIRVVQLQSYAMRR